MDWLLRSSPAANTTTATIEMICSTAKGSTSGMLMNTLWEFLRRVQKRKAHGGVGINISERSKTTGDMASGLISTPTAAYMRASGIRANDTVRVLSSNLQPTSSWGPSKWENAGDRVPI
jgi:hypothetical protein